MKDAGIILEHNAAPLCVTCSHPASQDWLFALLFFLCALLLTWLVHRFRKYKS